MAERPPSTTPRGWRDAATSRPRQGRSPLARRLAAVGLVLAISTGIGLVAGFAWLIWPTPSPEFVALWVDDYKDPRIPDDPSSARDYRSLAGTVGLPEHPPGLEGGWREELSGLGDDRGVIVYLSAHARLGPGGEVRILGAEARSDGLEGELGLRDVLAALKACPAPDKLLILDIMRPHADPSAGVLDDDVASGVLRELEAVPDEGRTVLGAASPGQTSWTSETLGRSVFNYYVDQGLRGEADADAGGTVTVGELADYVEARTSGWAWRNRNARQVPLLVAGRGRGRDALVFEPGTSTPKPVPAPPEEDEKNKPEYPQWLVDAWKRRGAWWDEDDGSYRAAPRLFRRWEAALLWAEHEWRMGVDPMRDREVRDQRARDIHERIRSEFPTLMRADLKADSLPSLRRLDPRYRPAEPETPRSVGLAEGLGRKPGEPERALAEAVLAWLMQIQNAPPGAKDAAPPEPAAAVKEFVAANKEAIDKDASGFALAWAVLDAAARPPDGDLPDLPGRLRLLAPLIERRPRPLKEGYVEMLLLADLAGRGGGDDPSSWSAATLQQAVEVLRVAERADGRPDSFPWVHDLLDRAGQERHVAEILLRSPGYVSDAEVRTSLEHAGRLYENLETTQRTIADTRRRLDRALAVLPPYLAYLEASRRSAGMSDTWIEAVDEARRGLTLLEQPPAGQPVRVGDLQQVDRSLAELLDTLLRPFGKESVDSLDERARRTNDPEDYREIDALLKAPFLAAEDRMRLWAAARGLGRRLQESPGEPPDAGTDEAAVGLHRRVADRARWSLKLLALGGIEGDELEKLYAAYESKPGPATEADLVRAIRDAWIVRLPERLDQASSADGPGRMQALRAADRLGRVVPPAQRSEVLDSPETNPTVRSAAAEAAELWGWLMRRYRYEAHVFDGLIAGTRLFVEAADACKGLAGATTREATPRLDAPGPGIPTLDAERPGAEATVRLALGASPDPREEEAVLRVFSPDARLEVEPRELTQALKPDAPASVRLKLTFKEGGAADPSRAEGVLVMVTIRGRAFPLRLPVGEGLGAAAPVPILSASPEAPGPPLKEIPVRPLMAPQKLFLHVRNPSARPRVVKIQVLAGGAGVPGGTAEVSIGPGKTERVMSFGPPAAAAPAIPPGGADADKPGQPAKPADGLIELAAPAAISLRLSYNGKPPLETTFPVRLAEPADYIIADALFEPAGVDPGGKNELSVRVKARESALHPPCAIHLVASRGDIPRLLADPEQAEDRVEVGGQPGEAKRAFVSDLRLDVGADPHGYFYLDVDDFDRAMKFGVNFLAEGPRQVPREERVPAIRRMRTEGRAFPDAPLPVLPGDPLPVLVEVDNAPPDSTLELRLGTPRGIDANPRIAKKGAKRRYLGLAAAADGSLAFRGAVKDQEFRLETVGLRGQRQLSARLLAADGAELDSMTREVYFDDQPPEGLRIIGLPDEPIEPGRKALDLRAEGFAPVVGIKSVEFFLGEPQEDGKRPEGARPIPARALNDEGTLWRARVPLPADTGPDPQAISVEFVNKLGKGAIRTDHVTFRAPPPPPIPPVELAKAEAEKPKGPTTGTIAGTLKEGPRPQRGLTVFLYEYDPQGKPKENASAKTDAAGKFGFKEVKPGKYLLTAEKPSSRTRADEQVEVKAGEVATADLKLSR